ncbi:MAG: phosphoribosyltransferase [bacterium]
MQQKIFIDANTLLIDSFTLARRIYEDGYRPDFLIGIWRGGTPPGIAIHEFFVYKGCRPASHTAIKVESYYGIEQRKEAIVDGMEKVTPRLHPDGRLLIVDDIFDTGKSIEAVKNVLAETVTFPIQVRVATIYYRPDKNVTSFAPDYFLKKVYSWVVFPHELEGLSEEEIRQKGSRLFTILTGKGNEGE